MSCIAGVAFYTFSSSTLSVLQLVQPSKSVEGDTLTVLQLLYMLLLSAATRYELSLSDAVTFSDILSPFNTLPNLVLIVECSLACECLVETRLKKSVAQRVFPTEIQELWNDLLSIISNLGLPVH